MIQKVADLARCRTPCHSRRGAVQQPGPQRVLLEYQPATLRWGLAASTIGLLLTSALYFYKREPPAGYNSALPVGSSPRW